MIDSISRQSMHKIKKNFSWREFTKGDSYGY